MKKSTRGTLVGFNARLRNPDECPLDTLRDVRAIGSGLAPTVAVNVKAAKAKDTNIVEREVASKSATATQFNPVSYLT